MKRILPFFLLVSLSLGSMAQQAKSVILVYLDGGPSQTDTFDPKPEATREIYGTLKEAVQTNVPDIIIGSKLPLLAQMADKYSLIRSMTHSNNGHETGHYAMITGDLSRSSIVYPSYGSVIAFMKSPTYKGILPAYVSVTSANSRFNEGGFLGNKYKSFDTGGEPEKMVFEVEGIINREIKPGTLEKRMQLLDGFEKTNPFCKSFTYSSAIDSFRRINTEFISGASRKVFDLTDESKEVRERYGMNRLGQSCLAARKLVEAGVPFINVRTTGWDTHKKHFQRMNEMLPELDQALSALLADLDEKGLLDSTIVLCGGEFGRTPKVLWEAPWNGGRAHFGQAFSYLVAGGGFIPGKVLGKTDKTGENITERKVYPCDLIGTVYLLMGIDPKGTLPHILEGNLPILPSLGKEEQSNGLLYELINLK
ncbi:MAG: hypothetical protein A2W90_05070 [Bacteroidetes bacterium GWF2_42_66]|nr:MAG: hypothetical protein A2W92_03245 [Bacteroidetes bacterium GWA2_42_15]OFX95955.1 MAG: hypothetical protein A2W89_02480 [Bacteroidetes bacterium GWE2_42_39]OFY46528.1 MAG: hypothetical protein A2W90_05070 [Bacteroidetes bacterium GWF2_42_66]HBL75619.1 DUF1501 domain-containing protein [Prolixibacteraceae bacterium]HCR89041.1 DUF1501 domain-containing protein [Prolixibacteraceae bacterium]